MKDLREGTGDILRDWERVTVTELNNAYNHGIVDEIVDRNKEKEKNEILVYAQGPYDERTCEYCKKHYHDDVTMVGLELAKWANKQTIKMEIGFAYFNAAKKT